MALRLTTSIIKTNYNANLIQNVPVLVSKVFLGNTLIYSGTGWSGTANSIDLPVSGSIDPNVNFSVLNPTGINSVFSLSNPTGSYNYKVIILQNTNDAIISTNLGTFSISLLINTSYLVFDQNIWTRYNTDPNTYQWYPSKFISSPTPIDELINSFQGTSSSISGNGTILAVGAINKDYDGIGLAFIYNTISGFWQQRAMLSPQGSIGSCRFGTSISLSTDGQTLAVGGPNDNNFNGAVWIFYYSSYNTTWNQIQKITSPSGPQANQGYSVSLNQNGSVVVFGGPNDDNFNIGATWVYTSLSGTWTQQAKLIGTGIIGGIANQGWSVAISSDGNTIASGGPSDDGGIGATWVFTKINGIWTQQAKLVGSDNVGASAQGGSNVSSLQSGAVSLSSDGNTLAVGGPYDDSNVGAVWIFTRNGNIWSQQTKIVPTGSNSYFGISTSLSSNGNTLCVGAKGSYIGNLVVFTRTSGTWTQQQILLGGTNASELGKSVTISSQGNVIGGGGNNYTVGCEFLFNYTSSWNLQNILVGTGPKQGGINYNGHAVTISYSGNLLAESYLDFSNAGGVVWVFSRTGTIWNQQGSMIFPTDCIGIPGFGQSLCMCSNESTLAVGGFMDNSNTGATWIYTYNGTNWTEQAKLVGTGNIGGSKQGNSVYLSSDGNVLAVGGPEDNVDIGAVWIFRRINGYGYRMRNWWMIR